MYASSLGCKAKLMRMTTFGVGDLSSPGATGSAGYTCSKCGSNSCRVFDSGRSGLFDVVGR